MVTLREAIGNLLPVGLGDQWDRLTDVGVRQENRCLRRGCLSVTEDTSSCLSLSVVDSLTGNNITTVEAAIAHALRDEVTSLKCRVCDAEGCRQMKSFSVLPKVKSFQT